MARLRNAVGSASDGQIQGLQVITRWFWIEDGLKMEPGIVASKQKCIDYIEKTTILFNQLGFCFGSKQ